MSGPNEFLVVSGQQTTQDFERWLCVYFYTYFIIFVYMGSLLTSLMIVGAAIIKMYGIELILL